MLWKGFYHDFSTKMASASASGGECSAPWTPKVPSPPVMIYPGAAPGGGDDCGGRGGREHVEKMMVKIDNQICV